MITTDNIVQFARAAAARHELITREVAALRVLIEMAEDAERVLDERQAQLDKDRAELATKRAQLRTWSDALDLLKSWFADDIINRRIAEAHK